MKWVFLSKTLSSTLGINKQWYLCFPYSHLKERNGYIKFVKAKFC